MNFVSCVNCVRIFEPACRKTIYTSIDKLLSRTWENLLSSWDGLKSMLQISMYTEIQNCYVAFWSRNFKFQKRSPNSRLFRAVSSPITAVDVTAPRAQTAAATADKKFPRVSFWWEREREREREQIRNPSRAKELLRSVRWCSPELSIPFSWDSRTKFSYL